MVDIYPVRKLSPEDVGVELPLSETTIVTADDDAPLVESDDPFVLKVHRLLTQFGGVLLSGVPGTGKSWWARQIAGIVTHGNSDHQAYVQFHASYQYEDFIYGYVPNPGEGGASPFVGKKAVLLRACETATAIAPDPFVLVIDEFSRSDVGRVFGEALTYIEDSKRGVPFTIAAGIDVEIPNNLLILATMNPFDRGVDEVDAAFERRFAKITLEPDAEILEREFLKDLPEEVRRRVVAWFHRMKSSDAPLAPVGHAYFKGVSDIDSLREVWEYQLKYHIQRAFRLNAEGLAQAESGWRSIFDGVSGGWDGYTFPEGPAPITATPEAALE